MTPKFRILYFSTQFPNQRSPRMGVFSLQRVLALRHAGCEVQVISPLLMNPPPGLITKPVQAYKWIKLQAQLPSKFQYEEIEVHYPKWFCPPKKLFGWTMSYFLFLQVRSKVMELARAFCPNVIISSWLPDVVAAAKFGNDLNIPTLGIADGTDVNVWPEEYRGWSYARDTLNEKISTIIFVSDALRSVGNSKGLYGKKNIVLHNAVDTHLFQPSEYYFNESSFVILGIGRFVRMKGFHVLLDAVARLNRSLGIPVHLILVGEGPMRDALVRQASDLGISSILELIDPMEQDKLVMYYQKADLFCLPSYSEGLPCVVVEAMACGKPVVASNVGGIGELVDEQSGILVAPGDADALCEALLQAKNHVWDAEIIRKKIVENFGWDKWTDTMLRLMDAT